MANEQLIRELLGDATFDALTTDEQHELTSGDPEWIEQLLRARAALPLPQMPALLSQNLRDLFDDHRLVQAHMAVLVGDSRIDRRLVGVRGPSTTAGWSYTYTCEAADVLLDVWPQRDGVDVDIQVMTQASDTVAYRAIARPVNEESVAPTARGETDQLGQIRLVSLAPTLYEFVLTNLRSEVALTVDLSDAQS